MICSTLWFKSQTVYKDILGNRGLLALALHLSLATYTLIITIFISFYFILFYASFCKINRHPHNHMFIFPFATYIENIVQSILFCVMLFFPLRKILTSN